MSEGGSLPIDPRLQKLTDDLGRLLVDSGMRLDRMSGLADDVAALRLQVTALNDSVQRLVPKEELERYPDLDQTLSLLNGYSEANRAAIARTRADLRRARRWTTIGLVAFFLVTIYGGLTLSDWRSTTCYPAATAGDARVCDDLFPLAPKHRTRAENENTLIMDIGANPTRLKAALCAGQIALPDTCKRAGLPYGPTTTTTEAP